VWKDSNLESGGEGEESTHRSSLAVNPFPPIMEEPATEQPEDTVIGIEGPSALSEDPEDLDSHEMKNASSAANLVAAEDREGDSESVGQNVEKETKKAEKRSRLLFFLKGKAPETSLARSSKTDEEHEGTF